jgi:two-component system OmpR family response regulator
VLRREGPTSYIILRIRCHTSAVGLEILSVEDDDNLAFVIMTTLRLGGFNATRARDGQEGLRRALGQEKPDLIVLDVMLPDLSGFEVCQRLRESGSTIPVIFLTAADSVSDKVRGLVIGGDDYLAKPFSGEELTARVRAKLRRLGKVPEDELITCRDITLDDHSHTVTKNGTVIDLSPIEYRLLLYFMTNADKVLSRWQILDHVWNYAYEGDPTIVESYVSQLRKKIDTSPPTIIRTVRSIGYRLERQ